MDDDRPEPKPEKTLAAKVLTAAGLVFLGSIPVCAGGWRFERSGGEPLVVMGMAMFFLSLGVGALGVGIYLVERRQPREPGTGPSLRFAGLIAAIVALAIATLIGL